MDSPPSADRSVLMVTPADLEGRGRNVLEGTVILRDPDGRLDFDQVRALAERSQRFEPLPSAQLREGFTDAVIWLRFTLSRSADVDGELYLVLWPPFIDRIDFFAPDGQGGYAILQAGDHVPVAERALALRETVFPVEVGIEPRDYFLRIESRSIITLSAQLKSAETLVAGSLRRNMRHSIFLGMVLTAVVIGALSAVWLRQRVFVLATGYLIFYFGFKFVLNGNDQLFIYPDRPWIGDNLIGVFAAGATALMVWFVLSYLEPKRYYPRLDITLKALAALAAACSLVALAGFYSSIAPGFMILNGLILLLLVALFLLMFRHSRQRALAMTVMFTPLLAAALLQLLHVAGVYGTSDQITGFWDVASLSQMPFAAVAILLRIRESQREIASELSYQMLVENQVDLVVRVDLEGRFEFVSPSYCDMFGKKREELLGRPFMPLVHEDDRERTAQAIDHAMRPPHHSYVEQRAWTRTGWRWLGWSTTAVLDSTGAVSALVGVGRDVTDRVEVEQALERSRQQLEVALEAGRIGFYQIDLRREDIVADDRCLKILGHEPGELDLDWPTWQTLIHPEDLEQVRRLTEERIMVQGQPLELEYRMRHREGHWLWLLDRVSVAEADADGKSTIMAGVIQDISRRKQAEDRLAFMVHHDDLTGLFNRRGISAAARHELAQARRSDGACCVAMADLDRFKSVNDSYGHEAGDRVLERVAGILLQAVREGDWVGRWGGEEFLLVFPDSRLEEAVQAMERVRLAVETASLPIDGTEISITISAGVAEAAPAETTLDEVIARADRLLYRAKDAGRNRVCS